MILDKERFKRISWPMILFLNIITVGIYPFFWFLRRERAFNRLESKNKLSKKFLIFLIVAVFSQLVLGFVSGVYDSLDSPARADLIMNIGDVVGWVAVILLTVVSFHTRKILIDHTEVMGQPIKINRFWTFLFNNLYLQYKLNDLIDDA